MRTVILAIGLIALALPALACGFNQTATQGQQTPMPVASSDQPPPIPQTAPPSKPQS
jgi:hypothetical protein